MSEQMREEFEKWWMDNAETINHRDILGVAERAWQAARATKSEAQPVGMFDVYGDSYIQVKQEYADKDSVALYRTPPSSQVDDKHHDALVAAALRMAADIVNRKILLYSSQMEGADYDDFIRNERAQGA